MNKVTKSIEIKDAKIQFVSLVDKAANKRQFLITKAEGGQAQFTSIGKVLKVEDSTHYITGIVYEPMVKDAHDNFMTEQEIQKAAYWFAKNGDSVDVQHSFETAQGINVVENYVAPYAMTIGGTDIIKGTWLMTVEVENDVVWDAVQKKEITGFSMGGIGKYAEKDVALEKHKKPYSAADGGLPEKKGVFKKLAELLGFEVVEKDTDNNSTQNNEEEINLDRKELQEMIDESIKNALAGLEKAGENQEGNTPPGIPPAKEAIPVDRDELQKMIDEAVKRALEASKKSQETPSGAGADGSHLEKMVGEQITKALEPLVKALNARGVPSNLNGTEPVQKDGQHYLTGIL